MPDDWNGRFYFQGGGGLNGAVNPPIGAQYAGDKPALAQGFAVVSTDSGHKAGGFDATFMEDQEAALNFLYQAMGKVTVVAKAIVAQHYGKAADHSYFVGCSTGGREAMIVSQRYPDLFRRHRRRRAGHAHRLLQSRAALGHHGTECHRAEGRQGHAAVRARR